MTTESIEIKNNLFYFEPTLQDRVTNPRHTEHFWTMLEYDKLENGIHEFVSDYDIEIYPTEEKTNFFCNIKTKLIWKIHTDNKKDFGSLQFSESLLYNILDQRHFMASLLRQNLINNIAGIGLLFKPNPKQLHEDLKREYKFLANLPLTNPDNFLFKHWYR